MIATQVHTIVVGRWRENCYIVSRPNGKALVIDPGDEVDRITDYLEEQHLEPSAVLVTHAHHDHVAALPELLKRFPVPWYLHSGERYTLRFASLMREVFDDAGPLTLAEPDGYFDRLGSPMAIGDFQIVVIETPGHTRGGVSFIIGESFFPGDTLFRYSVGRVDLPGGSRPALAESLHRLSLLSPGLTVFPGHGQSADLGELLSDNPDLRNILDERFDT